MRKKVDKNNVSRKDFVPLSSFFLLYFSCFIFLAFYFLALFFLQFLILLIRPALETPNGGTELLLGNSCLDIRLRWLLLTEHEHMLSQREAQDYVFCFISCNTIKKNI